MKNIITNIKPGQGDDTYKGFDYARKIADDRQQKKQGINALLQE